MCWITIFFFVFFVVFVDGQRFKNEKKKVMIED